MLFQFVKEPGTCRAGLASPEATSSEHPNHHSIQSHILFAYTICTTVNMLAAGKLTPAMNTPRAGRMKLTDNGSFPDSFYPSYYLLHYMM